MVLRLCLWPPAASLLLLPISVCACSAAWSSAGSWTLLALLCFSWLHCNSVQSPWRVKHGLLGQLLWGQNLHVPHLAVLDAFTALCAQDSPTAWLSVLPQPEQQGATSQSSLGLVCQGWGGRDWKMEGETVICCFVWDLFENKVSFRLSRSPKPSLPSVQNRQP